MAQNKRKKILLIEDNEPISIAYQEGLSEAGFSLFHIENGVDAIPTIKKIWPDIILLDLIMPKRDGFEVLEDIAQHPELAPIPVIVLTNLEDDFYTKEIDKHNVAKFLLKSRNAIKDIVANINEILEGKNNRTN